MSLVTTCQLYKVKDRTDIFADVWEYVDGTTMEPSDVTAKAAWKKKDRMALSMI
jgi:hypothetical protein